MTGAIGMVLVEVRLEAFALMAGLFTGYRWAVARLGPRLAGFDATDVRRRQRLFTAGLVALTVSVSWPIDTIGDGYLFSVHMLQYVLMSFVAAPLLVAGTPGWMLTALTEPIRPVVRFVAQPVVALIFFNAVLVLSHWPALVSAYLRIDAVHFGMHALWVLAAYVFWLPIVNQAPASFPKLSEPLQIAYLFASSIIPTLPASFLTWSDTVLFEEYATAPRLWGITPIQDTQAAGAMMKLGGGVVLWALIVVIFFRWAATQGNPAPRRAPSPPSSEEHAPT
ncbi:MAG: cytochrome c oxidase assembly protein [Acidimicrobiia bacterium]